MTPSVSPSICLGRLFQCFWSRLLKAKKKEKMSISILGSIFVLGISMQFIFFILGFASTSTMDSSSEINDCFDFFGPILNGIAYEFSRCYLQCSNETDKGDSFRRNIHYEWEKGSKDEDTKSHEKHSHQFEVERCQNSSKRAYVETHYLTFRDLRDCLASGLTCESSEENEVSSLVKTAKETNKQYLADKYPKRKICDINDVA